MLVNRLADHDHDSESEMNHCRKVYTGRIASRRAFCDRHGGIDSKQLGALELERFDGAIRRMHGVVAQHEHSAISGRAAGFEGADG